MYLQTSNNTNALYTWVIPPGMNFVWILINIALFSSFLPFQKKLLTDIVALVGHEYEYEYEYDSEAQKRKKYGVYVYFSCPHWGRG